MLSQFANPSVLKQIGFNRLARFVAGFAGDLKGANLPVPDPDFRAEFSATISALFASPEVLPPRLRHTLLTLEKAAAPENENRLNVATSRRLANTPLAHLCPLAQAMELFLQTPDELAQFNGAEELSPQNPAPATSNSEPSTLKSIENGPAKIEDLSTPPPLAEHPVPSQADVSGSESQAANSPPIGNQESKVENPGNPSDLFAFVRLAQLRPAQYDRVRKGEAKQLGIRVETLDAEVTRCRLQLASDAQLATLEAAFAANGDAGAGPSRSEPWPEPVNGAELLHEVAERFNLQVVLPRSGAVAITLWTGHAHAHGAFSHTPRLNLASPEHNCGKTTTLDLIGALIARCLRTENLRAAVLFRLVHQFQPVLLLDEVDSYLTNAEELRGLLNAGHKRGACAYRCEGEGNAVRAFKAFAPAVLAGIGKLPGTLADRSIVIPLMRAKPGQLSASFDGLNQEIETVLCRKLVRWVKDNFAAIQACKPVLPPTAFNRLADNWRPVFAIAEVAGGDWPRLALDAFNQLAVQNPLETVNSPSHSSLDLELLGDIRQIFAQTGAIALASKQLVTALCAMPDRPWARAHRGNPITETWLGRRLAQFYIRSRNIRVKDRLAKGYELSAFRGK